MLYVKFLHCQILFGSEVSLAAQKLHRKIAVTTVAASGLATIPLQKSQGFSLRRPQNKSLGPSDFWGCPQNRRKLAATMAASRRSPAILRPQRPRDTEEVSQGLAHWHLDVEGLHSRASREAHSRLHRHAGSALVLAPCLLWEVLNGVGVDWVGGIFVFFYFCFFCFFVFFVLTSFFFAFILFFSFFIAFFVCFVVFLRFSLGKDQTTAIYWENGEFHSDPVCTDAVQNFPIARLVFR